MDGGKYAPEITPSAEKIIASVIVAGWLALGYHHDGFHLAARAFHLLFLPLSMIWVPEQLASWITLKADEDLTPPTPAAAAGVRLVGWFVILAVPGWWVFMLPTPGD